MVKNQPAKQEMQVQFLSWEDTLEEEMAIHSSILAWEIPMDGSPPGSSVHGIFWARILDLVAISFFKGSSQPKDHTLDSCVSCTGTIVPPRKTKIFVKEDWIK